MHQTNGAKLTFVTLECYRDRNRHSPRAHSRSPHWPQPRRYIRNTQHFKTTAGRVAGAAAAGGMTPHVPAQQVGRRPAVPGITIGGCHVASATAVIGAGPVTARRPIRGLIAVQTDEAGEFVDDGLGLGRGGRRQVGIFFPYIPGIVKPGEAQSEPPHL